jgi:transcriptional regulator with XRE-family HTH domain
MGTRIRNARMKKGLTQLRFAEKIGTSQGLISLWENGIIEPSVKWIERIIYRVRINPFDLFPKIGTHEYVDWSEQKKNDNSNSMDEFCIHCNKSGKKSG